MNKIANRHFQIIELEDIEIDSLNVRKENLRDGLEALKISIQKVGLIHPIIVTQKKGKRGKFKLLVGQRRFTAFKELELKDSTYKEIPAIIINNIDDTTKLLISFTENISRVRLPYNDTIRVCDELFKKYGGPKSKRLEKISIDVGLSISTVVKYLSYRLIPEEVRELVNSGKIDRSQAHKLTSVFWPNSEKITKIAKYMVGMTKPEWENILDVGMEKIDSPFDEIIRESNKPSRKIRLSVRIDRVDFEKIKNITAKSKNKINISDFVSDIIKSHLKGQ